MCSVNTERPTAVKWQFYVNSQSNNNKIKKDSTDKYDDTQEAWLDPSVLKVVS